MRNHFLDISELDPQGFQTECGRLKRVYGKSDPPPPPDYAAAAQATAQGDIEAARTVYQEA